MAIEYDNKCDRDIWTDVSRNCNAKDSILTLFDPIMARTQGGNLETFFSSLDLTIAKASRNWLATGYQIAITNICALLDYGLATNGIMRAIAASTEPPPMPEAADDASNNQGEPETNTNLEAKGSDVVDPKDFKERLQKTNALIQMLQDYLASNTVRESILNDLPTAASVVWSLKSQVAEKYMQARIFDLEDLYFRLHQFGLDTFLKVPAEL
ncbi:uncharacterized protein PgNI_09100 [Pyricularia grisea]|uniref:Uncharacterized protein n=1 Tax=Pyricularia grisea TaxID=148305 RepID=A0A6P8ASY7_PYRGI|nr:uncharacterized protein PgNI_09100 [Pyricularia grisea]TLD05223.1 hypothetical protein PgNI_09100 [Pyricularia grisea]